MTKESESLVDLSELKHRRSLSRKIERGRERRKIRRGKKEEEKWEEEEEEEKEVFCQPVFQSHPSSLLPGSSHYFSLR